MPQSIACPVCGMDGTEAANDYIQLSPPVAPPRARVRVHPQKTAEVPAAAAQTGSFRRASNQRLGKVDTEQVKAEARAKLLWGDKKEEVLKLLMMNQFDAGEASDLLQEWMRERAATIRQRGTRRALIGVGLILIPLVTYLVMASIGLIFIKLLGATCVAGVYGAWLLLDGLVMVLSPKSERGDIADK